ncbi:MAG TPA: TonB family protein [Candidatus Sumerlaeota bacterium]|nr:TonB family protein [Candidatus Sumerlaeota bacterium]
MAFNLRKHIVVSIIGHVVIFVVLIVLNIVQPRWKKLERQQVTRIRFVQAEKKTAQQTTKQTPAPQKTPSPPKPEPTPKAQVTPKPEPKPEPTPMPKKVIPKQTPKPEPQKTPRPRSTPVPRPQTTPPPRTKPSPPRPQTTPPPRPHPPASNHPPAPRQVSQPVSPRAPLMVKHADLPEYYLLMATQKIESNFNLSRSDRYAGITCAVEFHVDRGGNISSARVIKSTGNPHLDRFAVDAVERTAHLGPLPDYIKGNTITITANFQYYD